MDPLDDLLANLAGGRSTPSAKSVGETPKPAAIQSSIEALLQQIGTGPIASPSPISPSPAPASPTPAPADQALLGSLQTHYDRLDQDQLESQRLAAAAAAQLRLSRQRSVAQLWLDRLDPNSGEALWFEQFAEGYSSRLAAAIELLAAEQA